MFLSFLSQITSFLVYISLLQIIFNQPLHQIPLVCKVTSTIAFKTYLLINAKYNSAIVASTSNQIASYSNISQISNSFPRRNHLNQKITMECFRLISLLRFHHQEQNNLKKGERNLWNQRPYSRIRVINNWLHIQDQEHSQPDINLTQTNKNQVQNRSKYSLKVHGETSKYYKVQKQQQKIDIVHLLHCNKAEEAVQFMQNKDKKKLQSGATEVEKDTTHIFPINQTKMNISLKYLFAIADGHGQNGHLVSQLIIHRLQGLMAQQTSDNHILSLSRTYNKLQDQLYKTNLFDVSLSGSTLLTAIINYPKLICANVGDSRAVLARKLDKQNWEIVHISEDHKPSLPKQRKRILKKGGKIHSFKDEQGLGVGPLRVWLPSKNMPGLAMSRSLGDNLCKSIGVTHEPQVVELQIEPQDKFIILGSDGVWQNVTSSQILNFLVPVYNQGKLQQCCDTLMHLCLSSSIRNPAQPIDDITFIIVFLNKPN